jgi:hypothetical protein
MLFPLNLCQFNSQFQCISGFPEAAIVFWICRYVLPVLPGSTPQVLEHCVQNVHFIALTVSVLMKS